MHDNKCMLVSWVWGSHVAIALPWTRLATATVHLPGAMHEQWTAQVAQHSSSCTYLPAFHRRCWVCRAYSVLQRAVRYRTMKQQWPYIRGVGHWVINPAMQALTGTARVSSPLQVALCLAPL